MQRITLVAFALLLTGLFADSPMAAEKGKKAKEPEKAKKNDKDPLSKFKDEDLAKIDFCFGEFVKALGNGEVEVVKAFLAEVPKNLAKLDLKKEADRKTFLQAYASLKGAQITASSRFAGGLASVKYAKPDGSQADIRMQNIAGRWKIAGE